MIWDPQDRSDAVRTELAALVREELRSALGCDGTDADSRLEEMTQAVLFFLGGNADCRCVDRRSMAKLVARAFADLGEDALARRLLLHGTGLIRSSEWEFTGGRSVWVLDLRQMTVEEDVCLELAFFAGLHIILESIAEVWDASRGVGMLGLRNVCATAAHLLGRTGNEKSVHALATEITRCCREKLRRLRCEREWDGMPEVMDMDL